MENNNLVASFIHSGTLAGMIRYMATICTFFCLAACSKEEEPKPSIETVLGAKVEKGTISQQINSIGTLHSSQSVVLQAQSQGTVTKILVENGQEVKAGTLLVQLDDRKQQASLLKAEAILEKSQAKYERLQHLHSKAVASTSERQEAEAKMKEDQAEVDFVKAELSKTQIIAPFDGLLGSLKIHPGAYVPIGYEVISINDIHSMKVEFQIPENFLTQIQAGQEIRVMVDAFPKETFKGTITAIDPKIDEKSHNLIAYATVENPEHKLRPGLFAKISITLAQKTDVLLIPEQAIIPRDDGMYVYVVERGIASGKIRQVKVEAGQRQNGKIEILSGLKEGEIIVVEGQEKTGNEESVKIANTQEMQ